MSEAEFTVFANIVSGVEMLGYAVCFTLFYCVFMLRQPERAGSRIKKILIVFLIYLAAYCVESIFRFAIYGWLRMLMITALAVAVSGFLDMDRKNSFLLSVLFFSVRSISKMIMQSADFLMSVYLVEGKTDMTEILQGAMIDYGLASLLSMLLFVFLLSVTARCLKNAKWELHTQELCYLTLIPITGILFGNIMIRALVVVKEGQYFRLYEQYPVFIGIVPLVAVLFYIGIISTLIFHKRMMALQEERRHYFIEEQQIHALQERMEDVEQFCKGVRQIHHEMRNHLTNIKGLVKNGRYEDVDQYISQIDNSISAYEMTIRTGNSVIDVIVNDKKRMADKLGVKFQSDFSYPLSDKYNAYDIGIILNNLLTNALEACEKINEKEERHMILSGRQKRKFFLIEVKNSFDGGIKFDTDSELPISTKQVDVSLHGMGLSNVKREVEKYMGDLKIKVRKNEFSATVLLQERRTGNEHP